jgi:hypothetical protein
MLIFNVVEHQVVANYDYALKYPEDERFHELDEQARIWKIYSDEAAAFDHEMVEELSDSLDILLIFVCFILVNHLNRGH